MNPRRARILAELGLVPWRLRPEWRPASPVAGPAPGPAPAAALALHVPGGFAAADAITRDIWAQVLAWLRLREGDVAWVASAEAAAATLPPCRDWSTPRGKRGLWLALKAVATRGR